MTNSIKIFHGYFFYVIECVNFSLPSNSCVKILRKEFPSPATLSCVMPEGAIYSIKPSTSIISMLPKALFFWHFINKVTYKKCFMWLLVQTFD